MHTLHKGKKLLCFAIFDSIHCSSLVSCSGSQILVGLLKRQMSWTLVILFNGSVLQHLKVVLMPKAPKNTCARHWLRATQETASYMTGAFKDTHKEL